MPDILIENYNGAFIKILAERSIMYELSSVFTFYVPNYKHMEKFKQGFWDGKIRLLNINTQLIYAGLLKDIIDFCKIRNYTYEFIGDFSEESFSVKEADDFIKSLNLPEELHGMQFEIRDYQIKTFIDGVRKKRQLFLSPTSSGKSLMIYLLIRYYLLCSKYKILVVVPNTTLIHQLIDDFVEYGHEKNLYHKIYQDQEKTSEKRVFVSTWQSIYNIKDKKWFEQFDVVIGDEAHLYKAVSLKNIMEGCINANIRFGFTGTLDGTLTNEMVLRGLFGPVTTVTTTMKLMKDKQISQFKIKSILLSYSEEERKMMVNTK